MGCGCGADLVCNDIVNGVGTCGTSFCCKPVVRVMSRVVRLVWNDPVFVVCHRRKRSFGAHMPNCLCVS